MVSIYAGTNGFFDDIAVPDVRRAEARAAPLHGAAASASLLTAIKTKKTIDDELKGQLNAALKEFVQTFATSGVARVMASGQGRASAHAPAPSPQPPAPSLKCHL